MSRKKLIGLIAGPALFFLFPYIFPELDINPRALSILTSTLWIAIWWITEAIPLAATSLLPIILFPLSGGLDIQSTASAYGNKIIFLYLGGFLLALAIEKWQLHKRIALNVIATLGTSPQRIILGFMLATAFLSLWISNTATSMMMVPIGMAVIYQMNNQKAYPHFGSALMLSIAYAASIGGMGTLIGTPTNAVFAAMSEQLINTQISFAKWFFYAFPFVLLLLAICWIYLTRIAFSFGKQKSDSGKAVIKNELKALGPIGKEEKYILWLFGLTALAWISRSLILNKFIPAIDDTIIAILASLILFLIPSPSQPDKNILEWNDTAKLPWGILLLFGGGLAIAAGFQETGLAEWIGNKLTFVEGLPMLAIIIIVSVLVNFLTEITSNVATATILIPILVALAISLNMHPYSLMVSATLAASCAFMLPVATPPNAVVFSSGKITISQMFRTGFWLNIISVLLITIFVKIILPKFWDLDLMNY